MSRRSKLGLLQQLGYKTPNGGKIGEPANQRPPLSTTRLLIFGPLSICVPQILIRPLESRRRTSRGVTCATIWERIGCGCSRRRRLRQSGRAVHQSPRRSYPAFLISSILRGGHLEVLWVISGFPCGSRTPQHRFLLLHWPGAILVFDIHPPDAAIARCLLCRR